MMTDEEIGALPYGVYLSGTPANTIFFKLDSGPEGWLEDWIEGTGCLGTFKRIIKVNKYEETMKFMVPGDFIL